jgi:hypothetical protein
VQDARPEVRNEQDARGKLAQKFAHQMATPVEARSRLVVIAPAAVLALGLLDDLLPFPASRVAFKCGPIRC